MREYTPSISATMATGQHLTGDATATSSLLLAILFVQKTTKKLPIEFNSGIRNNDGQVQFLLSSIDCVEMCRKDGRNLLHCCTQQIVSDDVTAELVNENDISGSSSLLIVFLFCVVTIIQCTIISYLYSIVISNGECINPMEKQTTFVYQRVNKKRLTK